MASALTVRAARRGELDQVLSILTAASLWERSRGIADPWPVPFPAEQVVPALDAGEVFLAFPGANVQPVATISLLWEDPKFWGARPSDAGYVHRLAVRPGHLGKGLGRSLLEWAATQTQAKGRAFLRLDCLAANVRLVEYYLEAGFEPRGTVDVGGFRCARFERGITPVAPPASSAASPAARANSGRGSR